MCPKVLQDASLFAKLLQIDRELAGEVGRGLCPACGGPLHRADYPRKPRGGPKLDDDALFIRFSFCCGRDGCRKRLTPPSVRFLGRKVFFSPIVILLSAIFGTLPSDKTSKQHSFHGVAFRTLERWQRWWRNGFALSPFWKAAKGLLISPPASTDLPHRLLDRFAGSSSEQLVSCLRFLTPISAMATMPDGHVF